jgi:hypothetical protein
MNKAIGAVLLLVAAVAAAVALTEGPNMKRYVKISRM